MRCFIAIPIPIEIKNHIMQLVQKFKEIGIKGRYTNIDNLHITLLFLGDINADEAVSVQNYLKDSLNISPFNIKIENISFFEKQNIPKILYLKITEGITSLCHINNQITNEYGAILKKNNLFSEKFSPHITLIRLYDENDLDVIEECKEISFSKSFTTTSINLYKSILTPAGPVYSVLFEKKLS